MHQKALIKKLAKCFIQLARLIGSTYLFDIGSHRWVVQYCLDFKHMLYRHGWRV